MANTAIDAKTLEDLFTDSEVDLSNLDEVNLDDIEDRSFEVMPKGWYNAEVFDIEYITFGTGSRGWRIIVKITDPEYVGRQLFVNLVNVPKALWRVKEFVKACAPNAGKFNWETCSYGEGESFEGCRLQVKLTIKKYEGEDQNNVNGYKSASVDSFLDS